MTVPTYDEAPDSEDMMVATSTEYHPNLEGENAVDNEHQDITSDRSIGSGGNGKDEYFVALRKNEANIRIGYIHG